MNAIDTLDNYLAECLVRETLTVVDINTIIDLTQKVYNEGYTEGKKYKILKVVKADD